MNTLCLALALTLTVSDPPPTGWPCVMVEHGGGGHRKIPEVVKACTDLANYGYVCFAYDVRGDGGTPAWNPGFPHPITEERTLIDSAEAYGIAASLAPAGAVDMSRLAATGFSQGGSHAASAAAWSGRVLPADPSGATPFVTHSPTLLAVASENHDFDRLGKNMPGGVLANDELIDDRDPTDPLLLMLNSGDFAGAQTWVAASFGAQTLPLLQTSRVPLFVMLAYQDFKHQPNTCVDAMPTLSVPNRLFLTTGGHTTPKNVVERQKLADMRRRWFDHFCKGVSNGVLVEA